MDDGRSTALSVWAGLNMAGMVILGLMVLSNPEASGAFVMLAVVGAVLWLLTYMRHSIGPVGLSFLYVGTGWYNVANAANPASQLGVVVGAGGALVILWGLWLRDESMRKKAEGEVFVAQLRHKEAADERRRQKEEERKRAEAKAEAKRAKAQAKPSTESAEAKVRRLEKELAEAKRQVPTSSALVP